VLSRPRPPSPAALEQLFGDSQANANGLVQTVEQGIGSVALLGNVFKIDGPALPWETQTDLRRGEAMPLSDYGVLPARAIDCRREGSSDTPHYQIHVVDDEGTDYRIAVNVQSQQAPSELLFHVDDDLTHPVTAAAAGLGSSWHPLPSGPGGPNLDYIRANLFEPAQMRLLPPDVAGPDIDLADFLDHYVRRAIADTSARLYAFGQRWGPEAAVQDKVFGFRPGNGVHDIHMNQGNSGAFTRDNGVWQDGGLVLHFPGESRWVGIFLAFQSQTWHTDDTTGNAVGGVPPAPGVEPATIQILAAMVNPVGPAPERETVLLLNASPEAVDLTGWRMSDRLKHTCLLPAGPLAAGATLQAPAEDGVQFGNQGGAITVLDAEGLKVAGVSYTAAQAKREGWTIVF
jgi:uncharacterized protein YukJ